MPIVAQYFMSLLVLILLISYICMIYMFVESKHENKGFFIHLRSSAGEFLALMSWVAIVCTIIGIIFGMLTFINNIIF